MVKNLLLSISFFSICMLQAQVKKTEFKLTPVGTSNVAQLNNKFDTISIHRLAPAPFSSNDFSEKKALLNAQRDAYWQRASRRVDMDTTQAIGPNMPFVQGGFTDSLSGSGIPNDNHMCIGNNGDIISVLNSNLRVYKGGSNLEYNVGLAYFGRIEPKNNWPNGKQSLTGSYDPKAMYDPIADRYTIVWLDGRVSWDTRIMVAISETNDAAGRYSIYHLDGNPLKDSSWTDYPILSQSENDIFVTVNLLKDNQPWQTAFKQSVIWQVDKKKLYNDKNLTTTLWSGIQYKGKSIWSICPVDQYYKSPRKEMYFLSVRPSDFKNDTVFLHKIDNTQASGTAKFSYKILKGDKEYGLGGSAYQPTNNFRLQTNDSRVLTAIYYYGNIQYAQNSIHFQTTAPSIMHGFISDLEGPTAVSNTLINSDTMDFGYPSMVYMGKGTIDHTAMLSFSHSSKTVFPGVSLVKIEPDKKISPIIRIKSGNDLINSFAADTAERWGDYSGIQKKYNEEGIFFLANSVGVKNRSSAGTYIGRLVFNAATGTVEEDKAIVFPNPGNGYYYFKFNNEVPQEYQLTVTSLSNGKAIIEQKLMVTDCGEIVIKNNLSALSHGNYHLRLTRVIDNKDILDEKVQKY